jgi:putative membrane-bound dehydrogenase-like protein
MALAWLVAAALAVAQDPPGNRLAYLDEGDPYYVSGAFPRLATPQWIGEEGVEAALVLSIDDMRDPEKYEAFLRPLLDRLKKIDGRAPVSIMSNALDPAHARLRAWLGEGLSLENHTWSHPHPLLRDGDFAKARSEVDRMTDLLHDIPGNRPVAFRTPWCDVLNTVSPRFFAEIFNGTTGKGRLLTIDSSIFTILAPRERAAKYLAHVPNFVNLVEDYPYPYVIGRLCWEFPAVVPDDSVAQRLNKPNSPETVRDLKETIDAVVAKQGTWTLVFHPHNWIRNDQLVELVDHAVGRHGKKVKFLTFREAQERLDRHLLDGHPLRAPGGGDNGVRLLDLDGDGFLDVVIGNDKARKTRLWRPADRRWEETGFPAAIGEGIRFGIVGGRVVAIGRNEKRSGAWRFDGRAWVEDSTLLAGVEIDGTPVLTLEGGRDRGVRLRDATNDGSCELIVGNESQGAVFGWSERERTWKRLSWSLPKGTSIVDAEGRDAGLRFADLNGDRHDDVVFSNAEGYSVHLFIPRPNALRAFPLMGWTRPAAIGRRGDPGEVPAIVRGGPQRTNGAWFHSGRLWVQNEETTKLPDHCDRRTFRELMAGYLPPPLSPEESMKRIRLRPGFRIELVAAEPLLHDPVNFEWGADGKLWVVEMLDYPLGLDGKGMPGGRVRFLEDTDGDGRYDRSTVFLEGLSFPTGVMPWRRGVLVSAAPEVLYAEDTDGDGRADLRKVLLSGFGLGNQQHRVNGFQYGLDNWVYGANGGSGGRILSTATGRLASIQGRDFRLHPDTGAFEPAAGLTEFGRHRDDWGNWFGNNHPTWGWHYWLPEHYLPRNPKLAVRGNKRVLGDLDLTFRVSPLMARPQMARRLDHVTAPCGLMPYRDDLFGPGFESSVFIGEVDKNLVRRFVLTPDGVTFTGRRAADEQDREFLASTDNWFRPTMTKTGPDGALYVADMCRLIIEHQEYYPRDTHDLMDFRAGSDRGRLYRVVPEGATLRAIPRLDRMAPAELAAAMESPNGWQRDTVQRLLVHAQDRAAVDPLRQLARGSVRPKVRLQALCALEGLDGLDAGILAEALGDAHGGVREHAVRLCEPFLRTGEVSDALAAALLARSEDPEIRVRFQLAFTLGEWRDARAGRALAALGAGDEAMRIAALSSAVPHAGEMLAALLARGEPPAALAQPLLGLVEGETLDRAIAGIVRPAADGSYAPWQFLALAAVMDSGSKPDAATVEPVVSRARRIVTDASAPVESRAAATALLARGRAEDGGLLADLLDARTPEPVQRAALERLSRLGGPEVAEAILSRWRRLGPAARDRALDLLLGREAWLGSLLAALERGAPAPGELDPARQQRLRTHADPKVRERAAKLLSAVNADREKVVQEYRTVEGMRGDAARGRAHFARSCASCHRFKDEGHAVGPDLGQAASKSVQDLVVAILDPTRNIAGGYAAYRVVTADGRDLSGVIAAETANSVTLRMANGVEEAIPRDRIRLLAASTLSMMPDGLEKAMTPQDLADLFAFLMNSQKEE